MAFIDGTDVAFGRGESSGERKFKERLIQKINEKLYELRGMHNDYREGQRSVWEWVKRELYKVK